MSRKGQGGKKDGEILGQHERPGNEREGPRTWHVPWAPQHGDPALEGRTDKATYSVDSKLPSITLGQIVSICIRVLDV